MVSDDENSQEATHDAFELLRFLLSKRLQRGKLTVIDATNVQEADRKDLIRIARDYHVMVVGIVFNFPEQICHERNASRSNRQFGPHVVRNHLRALRQSLRSFSREGIRDRYIFKSPEEVDEVTIERVPLWTDKRSEHGPFDIIGDVHGCFEELSELLEKLGWTLSDWVAQHPEGRKLVFVGDLVDRGPNSPDVLRLAMSSVATGTAICVPGNHDVKLLKKLSGRDVQIAHGLAETLAQLDQQSPEFIDSARRFLDGLVSHYILDDGKLVVAHAGMKENLQGRASSYVREFALYGETTG